MLEYYWTVLLFPLIGAALNGLAGRRFPAKWVGRLGSLTILASFLLTLAVFVQTLGVQTLERRLYLFSWIEAGGFSSDFALLVDPLSLVMMLIVTGVGFLIHVYSIEYMAGESGYYRYFAYLNLFILMMSVLVLADNYLLMFVGWEGVGLCSFLLIGYYFERKSAGDAAKKAFIVNRIGDVGYALGIFLIFKTFGSVQYTEVFASAASGEGQAALSAICLLLFVGAVGKSAQIPLYVWLPDAMEGPTPVSALIHAATMVTAGVYMIARSAAFYSRAPEALAVVALVGLATALLAALIALAQSDIKKVLAYSTVSQLGYMFLAVGVGAFGAGIFHLMTHAFFKALLFLGSGSVILAMHHQQDMFKMGGLKKYLPRTYWTMLIATGAIAGVPLLAGFFSKDEILWKAYSSSHGGLAFWLVGAVVAGLTAFYMFRLMFLTFHGEERIEMGHHGHHHGEEEGQHGGEGHGHAHPQEPSGIVTVPLLILAVFSALAGYFGLPAWTHVTNLLEHYLESSFRFAAAEAPTHHSVSEELGLTAVTVAIAALAIFAAYRFYIRDPAVPARLSRRFSGVYRVLRDKFYVDEVYEAVIVRPVRRVSRGFLWKFFDDGIIDGMVNGVATLMRSWSRGLRLMQSGYARSYAAWIFGGAALLFLYFFMRSA